MDWQRWVSENEMHLESPHESFMEDTMLSKDYGNMAVKGILSLFLDGFQA